MSEPTWADKPHPESMKSYTAPPIEYQIPNTISTSTDYYFRLCANGVIAKLDQYEYVFKNLEEFIHWVKCIENP